MIRPRILSLIFSSLAAASGASLHAQTIEEGFDASALAGPFTNSAALLDGTSVPAGLWTFDNAVSFDGIDSIKSVLPNRSENQLSTTIQGPATVSFRWKIDAIEYFDSIRFNSSNDLASLGGVQDWQQRSFLVDTGEQKLQWSFTRFASHPVGTASAWLDDLVITPIPNKPGLQSALDHFDHTIHSVDWVYQEKVSAQNGAMAKSGPVSQGGKSSLVLEVAGPAVVKFDWGIESDESAESSLGFYVNNNFFSSITGVQALHERSFHLKPGTQGLKFQFYRDFDSSTGSEYQGGFEGYVDNLRIETYPESPALAEAVERDGGVYSTSWIANQSDTYDGIDALAVTAPVINESKILFVDLPPQAGLLTFWTKVRSEAERGFLYAFVDGKTVTQRSGIGGWAKTEINLPARTSSRLLEVYFYRDGNSNANGTDYHAWLDQVRFQPGATNYQADMAVAPRGKKLMGDNIINRSGGRQTATHRTRSNRPYARFVVTAKNASGTDADRVYFRGSGSLKRFQVLFVVRVGKQLLNYTAAMRTGKFSSLELKPGVRERHELWVSRKAKQGTRQHAYTLTGRSKADPRKIDVIRTRLIVRP